MFDRRSRRLLDLAAGTWERSLPLRTQARRAASVGFGEGGRWMASAMAALRGTGALSAPSSARFWALGLGKYLVCLVGVVGTLALAWATSTWWLLASAPVVFYAAEVQMLFLFPAAIDGSACPLTTSRLLLRRSGGTVPAIATVMGLAARMLAGGFVGGGFVRSWALGCLAVVHWYEELVGAEEAGWTA